MQKQTCLLLQSRIVLGIGLVVQTGRDQHFRRNFFAFKVLADHVNRRLAHAVGELNGITHDLAV